jgi:hypothetical protein
MGLLAQLFGRSRDLPDEPLPPGVSIRDARAVDQYERMLRVAPPHTIEQAHVEAFEKLTPEQLHILFERFNERATKDDERPSDAQPASLARSAVAAETRKPGTLTKLMRPQVAMAAQQQGADGIVNTWLTVSLLVSVAWYAIASAAWSPWYFAEPDDPSGSGMHGASDVPDAVAGDFGW